MICRQHQLLTGSTGAIFSDCEQYRYRLWRIWNNELPLINWLMLNPSTADELANDPTIERCERRSKEWLYGGLIVTNLFSLRSTDPRRMISHAEPGNDPHNDAAIIQAAAESEVVVCAWGNHGTHRDRGACVFDMLKMNLPDKQILALQVNRKSGQPCHPLYLPYNLHPTPFDMEAQL